MDRAHRLGQSRTVNVYRVLTRGTIEERIMGLQRFKMDMAAAVVNTDNMSMDAMDTSQLLDMFQVCLLFVVCCITACAGPRIQGEEGGQGCGQGGRQGCDGGAGRAVVGGAVRGGV